MEMQKVTVMGWADQKKILKAVRKIGKRAELWPYPYTPEYHGFIRQYYPNNNNNINYQNNNNHHHHHYNYDHSHSSSNSVIYSAIPAKSTKKKSSYNSKYNYYKHGYNNGDDFGYYHKPIGSTMVNDTAMSMFSDDNPHACSIM